MTNKQNHLVSQLAPRTGCTAQAVMAYEAALRVARAVMDSNSSPDAKGDARAFLCGGWVRDRILQRDAVDLDLEVFGLPWHDLIRLLDREFSGRLIEPSVGSPSAIKILLEGGSHLDVLVPLTRSQADFGRETFEPAPWISLREAAQRRDFSINSLYFDPIAEELQDPWGGVEDLERKILRLVPGWTLETVNAAMPFRAARLHARFGLSVEKHTSDLLKDAVSAGVVKHSSKEVVTREFLRVLLDCPQPSTALRCGEILGWLKVILPELVGLQDIPQDPGHHPEGSVFAHTLLAVDAAARISQSFDRRARTKIMLSTLLHDIGKLTTTQVHDEEGRTKVTSYRHEIVGAEMTKKILKRFDLASDVDTEVVRVVRHHMRPLGMHLADPLKDDGPHFRNEVRKLARDVYPASMAAFLTTCRADRMGRGGTQASSGEQTGIVDRIASLLERRQYANDPRSRLLVGSDLVEMGFENRNELFRHIFDHVEKLRDIGRLTDSAEARRVVLLKFGTNPEEVVSYGVVTPEDKEHFFKQLRRDVREGRTKTRADILDALRNYGEARMSSQASTASDDNSADAKSRAD